jgi:two-component system phosphate regulon sensor histidine kinase PhoR
LTSISLSADVLEEESSGENPARLKKYVAILKEQVSLMHNKVDKVLLQAATEQRFFRINKEKFPLKDFLSDIKDEFNSRVEHADGKILLDCPPGNPSIMADKTHFSGVMINLLDNALKYTVNPPEIFINLTEQGNKIILSVRDNGVGIEKKHLQRVFMPFFRVPSGNIHNVKGSGLGLSYVKRICNLHGWKIRVESEPGKGTTVKMTIPKAT